MASKKKTVSAVVAVALAAAILLGGTFAWQSISQEALNEVYGFVNPGGRLHDDFHEVTDPLVHETRTFDKDVYVENFTTVLEDGVQIFARVRLDEYMEIGKGAGMSNADVNKAESLVNGATLGDKSSWHTHIPGDTTDPFHDYWDWTMAGQGEDGTLGVGEAEPVFYMPTFNKDKDSLQPDVNGTFDGPNGVPDKEDAFKDYDEILENTQHTKWEIYDHDEDTDDQLGKNGVEIKKVVDEGKTYLTGKLPGWEDCVELVENVDHHAKPTEKSKVITMEQWLNLPDDAKIGNYWVWDIDGWAYWASPIDPDTATGVFLDGIARTKTIINEEWYYGINVVAQFITVEDIGAENGTGFYDTTKGDVPSSNALKLLSALGVKVEKSVSTAEALTDALAVGGTVAIPSSTVVEMTEATAPTYTSYDEAGNPTQKSCNFAANCTVTNGTTLSGEIPSELKIIGTANEDNLDLTYGVFLWTEEGNGSGSEEPAVLENMTVTNGGAALVTVYSQALKGNCVMNNVVVNSTNAVGIASELHNGYDLVLNNCTVTQSGVTDDAKPWTKAAVVAWGKGSVVINGGNYTSEGYAAYVYSTGGKIVINDGVFTGALGCDGEGSELIIKGGTFDHDPTAYVDDGYKAVETALNRWTVTTA